MGSRTWGYCAERVKEPGPGSPVYGSPAANVWNAARPLPSAWLVPAGRNCIQQSGLTIGLIAPRWRNSHNWAEAMGYPNPQQAVVAYLARPRGEPQWQSAPSPAGWRGAISRGGGFDANPSTVRFVKQRGVPGHELHAVAFADQDGKNCRFLVGVVQAADGGWEVKGLAGGGGSDPPRDQPWVNFCGWGWPHSFSGGGWVTGSGSEAAARVRLRFREGPILEDTIDGGVVLLIADAHVDVPATAEILDATGSLLASHSAFGRA